MQHRHLNHQEYTLASIDDVISRGQRGDWAALRRKALQDPQIAQKILRVCAPHAREPYAQRYFFWRSYAQRCMA
jgi:hypothetical protein